MREENKGASEARGREECGETNVEGVDYGNSDLKLLTPTKFEGTQSSCIFLLRAKIGTTIFTCCAELLSQ